MKNTLKIALVAMISTCNADPASDRAVSRLNSYVNNDIHTRKFFESNITEALYKATKEIDMDGIKAHAKTKNLKNVKLEGFVLYGIPLLLGETNVSTDILVSMHEGSLNYNIVHVKDHNIESTSPSLTGYVKEQVPSEGYFVLTDEAKNKIAENGSANSAYKPGFEITPLRAEAFKSALSKPTVEFDKAKFMKEHQLTDPKLQETTSDTLEQIKAATDLKRDTDALYFDLNKAFISDASLLDGLDLIDSFVQNIAQHVRPGSGQSKSDIESIITREMTDNLNIQNNAKKDILMGAFFESSDIFAQYVYSAVNNGTSDSDYSIDLLKAKCKNDISNTIAYRAIRANTSIEADVQGSFISLNRSVKEKMEAINKAMLNDKNTDHTGHEYNADQITSQLTALKSKVNNAHSDIQIKADMINLIEKYQTEKLPVFNFDDEKGNEIYLDESFFSLDSSDHASQLRLLQLSRHNNIAVNVFEHDMIFPKQGNSGSEITMPVKSFLHDAMRQERKLFGMYLYNSEMKTSEIKAQINNETDAALLVNFLDGVKGNMSFSDTLKDILETKSTTQNKINELSEEDYTQLYSAVYVKSDYEHMKEFENLQNYLRNIKITH